MPKKSSPPLPPTVSQLNCYITWTINISSVINPAKNKSNSYRFFPGVNEGISMLLDGLGS
jgi:hypothetical protein